MGSGEGSARGLGESRMPMGKGPGLSFLYPLLPMGLCGFFEGWGAGRAERGTELLKWNRNSPNRLRGWKRLLPAR